ncbi:peptide/nickel transport system permease protein [Salegentibacter echinorum]|uniref:Peptide/nickel transport system permease protein n=1 Tax=Salegentibacter echinorum TaxID=1073325 RepID=A0A1M5K4J7_SALEC|nr:ABC transporter permease [Salegentibacter echinorum]SHG47685.1 peptide/nickel transport system permease protein [Salegentibacter echinorum]
MAKHIRLKYKLSQRFEGRNPRKHALIVSIAAIVCLFTLVIVGAFVNVEGLDVNFMAKNNPPSFTHIFGTDWLGRDMLIRTLKGLNLSFWIGVLAATLSVIIAVSFSILSSVNKTLDAVVTWLIDLFMGIPHIITLILISFALGGGLKGVVIGVALTHWPMLTRLLRAEVMQIKSMEYIGVSQNMGKSWWWIGTHHILPHLLPQLIVGFILLFPHAILHEAAITFLGFGLSSEQPAIGIILSEAMRYLSSGMWWLAFFPGFSLLIMVFLFDVLGRNLRKLIDPLNGQKL